MKAKIPEGESGNCSFWRACLIKGKVAVAAACVVVFAAALFTYIRQDPDSDPWAAMAIVLGNLVFLLAGWHAACDMVRTMVETLRRKRSTD